jgi:hypothetical protein
MESEKVKEQFISLKIRLKIISMKIFQAETAK